MALIQGDLFDNFNACLKYVATAYANVAIKTLKQYAAMYTASYSCLQK